MKKIHVLLLAFGLLGSTAFAQQKYVGWSMGYLPNYENFSVSKVNWKAYTIITWFSVNGDGSGNVNGMTATAAKAFTTACHQNNTKAVICFGGAGAGGSFTSATTSSVLPTFINNMVSFMQANAFDGIDIDWEDGVNNTQFAALVQGLSAAFAKITPKPLLTIATADYLSGNSAPVAAYADQLNLMSYYDGATSIPSEVKNFIKANVPKNKLGIGYGYDTDDEFDGPNEAGNGANGNPTDIQAKCDSVVDNGYGGLMVWEIDRAPAACDAVTAMYVNKNAPASVTPYFSNAGTNGISLSITSNRGLQAIHYALHTAGFVDLGLYDMKGTLIQNLTHGARGPGMYSIALDNGAGVSIKPGAYVIKLATPTGNQAGEVVLK